MRALLDINVLLALFDSGHTFHARALRWWSANKDEGWASCPLTENGYLRIVSQASYPRPVRLADATLHLRTWAVPPLHAFWPDDVSILDAGMIDYTRLLSPKKITDVYLLALAVKHGGRLVTLDTGISVKAVRGAEAGQLVVV
jgi:toxin-antitoxin system PIN domain toxin